MDSDLEKHYLNRSLHTDAEISDMKDKKYYQLVKKILIFQMTKQIFSSKSLIIKMKKWFRFMNGPQE